MRICLIAGEFPPLRGGLGDYTRRLASTLTDMGETVVVLTSARARPQAEERFPVFPIAQHWGFSSWGRILRALAVIDPQVVHIQYQTAAYAMQPAVNFLPLYLSRKGYRIISTFHDLRVPYLFPKAGRLRQWANLALIKASHGVIVTNEEDWGKARAIREKGLYLIPIGSNIDVLPLDSLSRQALRRRWRVDDETGLVGYFGFLHPSKGVDLLLDALHQLLRKGERVALLMIGETVGDSDPSTLSYKREVMERIGRLGLDDALRWTGYLPSPEISASLASVDICVLPFRGGASFRRGTLMAALAHGLPIITTHPPAVPGQDQDQPRLIQEENCVLVPDGDEKTLAQAMENLLHSSFLREKLGKGARELAQAFSWEAIAAKTIETYRALLP